MERQKYLGQVRKFTDEEFLELYRKGFTDKEISKTFRVHPTSIQRRRYKFCLISNGLNPIGKTLTKEEVIEAGKKIKEASAGYYTNWVERNREKISKYNREYYRTGKERRQRK